MSENGKVVLITGAVKNSGYAMALKFAREGYSVCITSRNARNAAQTAAEISREYGVPARGFGLDLESPKDIRRVFGELYEEFHRLDVFVGNSANLGVGILAADITEEEYDGVMNVNAKGNFFCCQEAYRIMRQQHSGSIVLIGSVHARGAIFGRTTYAMSKGAISSLTRNLAFEFAGDGVRVNSVVPGAVRTDRWDSFTPEQEAARRKNWPLGMEASGDDIANAVYFLASDQSKSTTGTELVVDSGVLTCLLAYNGGKH